MIKGDFTDDLAQRFGIINLFYAPKFRAIFEKVIDKDYNLNRATLELNQEEQEALDLVYNVPDITRYLETKRIFEKKRAEDVGDEDIKGVDFNNIYRYYGSRFKDPLYDLETFELLP